ncbi:MAG: hypothetical protein QW514_00900 [Thermoprotei archaeon]
MAATNPSQASVIGLLSGFGLECGHQLKGVAKGLTGVLAPPVLVYLSQPNAHLYRGACIPGCRLPF